MNNSNNTDPPERTNSTNGDTIESGHPIEEKWIIAFFKSLTGRIYYRQFFAAGFYEAYDRVVTFSEKTNYQILWYKEKRKCELYFDRINVPFLEYVCTFCNGEFNNMEPIRCNFEKNIFKCKSEFCSLKCKQEHFYHVHIKRR